MIDVVLDVDTGVDDALALLLACRSPVLRVRAVTCVAGNTDVDQVVANTLRVIEAVGAMSVPVARGAAHPIARPQGPARLVHGRDGMADLALPVGRARPVDEDAVKLLRRTLEEADQPLTLVMLGPLTNLAALIRSAPDVLDSVGQVLVASSSGPTPTDFNREHDPEAAEIVLRSGLPIRTYGLDVVATATVDATAIDALLASQDAASTLAGRLLAQRRARFGRSAVPIGDAALVASLVNPAGTQTGWSIYPGGHLFERVTAVDGPALGGLMMRTIRSSGY